MRPYWRIVGGAAALAMLVSLASAPLWARPTYRMQFQRIYKSEQRSEIFKASCMLCHESRRGGGGKLNPYGADLRKASRQLSRKYRSGQLEPAGAWDAERGGLGLYQRKAYRAVEQLDSDKDGAKNLYEIEKDRLPGQNWSTPPKPKPEKDILDEIREEQKKQEEPDSNKGEEGGEEEEPPEDGGEGGEG